MNNQLTISYLDKASKCKSDNFIGILLKYCKSDKETIEHRGLLLCLNNIHYLLHYTSKEVQWSKIDISTFENDWYIKRLDFFESDLIATYKIRIDFIVSKMPKLTQDNYGFIFSNYLFDEFNHLKSDHNIPILMTCSGFILAILDSLLISHSVKFLNQSSWPPLSTKSNYYLYTFRKLKELEYVNINDTRYDFILRIRPIEILSAGYIEEHNRHFNLVSQYATQVLAHLDSENNN